MCKPNVEQVRNWESRVAILMVKALEFPALVETLPLRSALHLIHVSDGFDLHGDADYPMCLQRVVRPDQDRAGNSQ